jgi:hypothetical protein
MKAEEHKDSCTDHYRIHIEVDRCDGFHGAVGINVTSSTANMIEGFTRLWLASARTDEERTMATALSDMLKAAFVKPARKTEGPIRKVVPFRRLERGPFASTPTITRCTYIEGPHLEPGWGCCACAKKHPDGSAVYNGILRDECKVCGHECCLPGRERTKLSRAAKIKTAKRKAKS